MLRDEMTFRQIVGRHKKALRRREEEKDNPLFVGTYSARWAEHDIGFLIKMCKKRRKRTDAEK